MVAELIQILFTFLGAVFGLFFAPKLAVILNYSPEYQGVFLFQIIFTSLGFLLGYYLTKKLRQIVRGIDEIFARIPGIDLIVGTIGLLTGLTIALLFSVPLSDLPNGNTYTLISFFVCGFLGLLISLLKSRELAYYLLGKKYQGNKKVIDTSALIDGRILALLENNALDGALIIPDIVVKELKGLADSNDEQKRKRGQRGLSVLERITEKFSDRVITQSVNIKDKSVDEALLEVCRLEGATLVTADSNLALFGKSIGIPALNLNRLQSEMKIPVEAGEKLRLKLVRKGRAKGQAVGYLDDGTMVVVENSDKHIGREVEVSITGITFSHTGRVVFAELEQVIDK